MSGRRLRCASVVLGLALALAGCGDDGGDDQGSATAGDTSDVTDMTVMTDASDDAGGVPATDPTDPTDPTTDAPAADPLVRLRAIVVQPADLPAEAGWVPDPEAEPGADADSLPTDCLGLAFDAVGVHDLDESDGAVQRSFSAPDAPSFLAFGAASSDPMPDLDRLGELVEACDGVTDPDGTNYIVVRQPQFETEDASISFAVNADRAGSMFNLVFVMAQRDDVTLFSAATAVVGEAEPDVEAVLTMMQLMLGRV